VTIALDEFGFYTNFRGMDVEVQAMVERVVNGGVVAEKRLYLRNGKQADWLLTKATSQQERLLDKQIAAASYG
jgi:NAD kinase